MESKAPGLFLSSSKFHAGYSQNKEGGGIIDLGLSLGTIQHETYHSSGHMMGLEGYGELIDWSQSELKSDDASGHGKWEYVKVNMEGFVVGRKVCVLDHGGYSSLARQLEDMFGMLSMSRLRLLEDGSEFSLVYKDKEGSWKNVGDVPWKEFVESVKRLRIARRKDEMLRSSNFQCY